MGRQGVLVAGQKLPVVRLLLKPEFAWLCLRLLQSEQDWCLGPLVESLMALTLGHVRVDVCVERRKRRKVSYSSYKLREIVLRKRGYLHPGQQEKTSTFFPSC